jgi:hypothetical protein
MRSRLAGRIISFTLVTASASAAAGSALRGAAEVSKEEHGAVSMWVKETKELYRQAASSDLLDGVDLGPRGVVHCASPVKIAAASASPGASYSGRAPERSVGPLGT